ncbi:MAG: diguanylate cyclase [Bacilli bacterium]|nr:diguanylate cyclase [Bacilli bacterium]
MKKGKVLTLIVIVLISIFGLTYFFAFKDEKTSLTLSQKKWIENNKNNIIDFAVINGVPIVNENGKGVLFDFLDSMEKDTGLEFNKISYSAGSDVSSEYALKVGGEGLKLFEDEYVIITKEKVFYNRPEEIKNLKLGYVKDEVSDFTAYLKGSENLIFNPYESAAPMIEDIKNGVINGAVVPKLDYLDVIFTNKFNISYSIDECSKDYVISLGSNVELNKIITQYFENYKKSKYKKSFDKNISDVYFKLNKIDEKQQTKFRSKRYNYGFVLNSPFSLNVNGNLKGLNTSFVKDFSNMAGVEIAFKRYSSNEALINDFNNNNLDLAYGDISGKFDVDIFKTSPLYNNVFDVISKDNTSFEVNNLSSFKGMEVLCIKGSDEARILKKNGAKLKEYSTLSDLISNVEGEKIALIDSYSYDYYVRNELKNAFKIKAIDLNVDYGFINRNVSENKVFNTFMNFYFTFINQEEIINNSYKEIISSNNNIMILEIILSILVCAFLIVTLFFIVKFIKKRKKFGYKLSKSDKLRYIDSLTSLKNRNYLNDNISNWDMSKVYPQSVIIIDLNNVAYINDNFGHKEGDKVISEGASVLVNNQLSDSEIIRTNGNEFLVFTIGHDERDIITYIRKINKGLRELSHGFGAAIGYSMIYDEIKTVDDAINEATSDMRSNKVEE